MSRGNFFDNAPDYIETPPPGAAPHDHHPDGMPNGTDDPRFWEVLFALQAAEREREPDHAPGPLYESSALWILTDPWVSAEIPRRPWIAKGYLMRGAVTVVSGPGSAGKSSLMVAWAAAAVTGTSFKNFKMPGVQRIATYNVEDDQDEQKRRFSAMFRRFGLDLAAFGDRLAIIGPKQIGTLITIGRDGKAIASTAAMDELEAFVSVFRPDVLMLDPFVELHDADENDNTAIRAVMAWLRVLAAQHNMAVVVLHHVSKGAKDPGDPDSLRGASSIVGAARVVLTLNVMTKEEAKTFGIPADKRRNYFRLDGAKSNYAAIEDAEWFERQEIRLDNGSDDEPGDGVAVAWPWKPPSVLPENTNEELNRVLDILAAPPAGWLYAPTAVGANSARWAGTVLIRELGCSDEQAKTMVKAWLRSGLLYEDEYKDDAQRKMRKGVRVNNSKRPTE